MMFIGLKDFFFFYNFGLIDNLKLLMLYGVKEKCNYRMIEL